MQGSLALWRLFDFCVERVVVALKKMDAHDYLDEVKHIAIFYRIHNYNAHKRHAKMTSRFQKTADFQGIISPTILCAKVQR